jgi:hypothetical protein
MNNSGSWVNAYQTLQKAIDEAGADDTIFVAQGTT